MRRQLLTEIALVFLVFLIQGAAPVPEVNEPYYLGKAIHYWNPDWGASDFFLDSADTHLVFYYAFGWQSLVLSPSVLAWTGRLLTWALLAWAWQRLSFTLVPRPWWSVLTAGLLVMLVERCHMAGEWIIGGVEAKGFAFVLVFLGLEAMVRGRWNRTWLLLGAAAAFHVLAGGWAVVAAALAWLLEKPRHCVAGDQPHRHSRRALVSMLPALLAGFTLSLPGLFPSLLLNWGTEPDVVREANQVYVYQRLAHHLDPTQFPVENLVRFGLLIVVWAVMMRVTPENQPAQRLRAWVVGSLALAAVGLVLGLLEPWNPPLAAGLLRFYWFRLADVAVPMGVALGTPLVVMALQQKRPTMGRRLAAAAIALTVFHVESHALERPLPTPPPAARLETYGSWRLACDWIAQSGKVPARARFLTPLMSQTFKWYTGRAEVVNWKEIPQDARAIVQWWRRVQEIHATGSDNPMDRWHESLARISANPRRTAQRLRRLGKKYQADYLLTESYPRLPLKVAYENRVYIIYRLPR